MVIVITSTDDLKEKLADAGDKLVVIDFFATWCGPCKMIAPKYEDLSKQHTNIVFLKVDVDECEEISLMYNISSMPTFVFIKNGVQVHHFAGASMDKLLEAIEKHQ